MRNIFLTISIILFSSSCNDKPAKTDAKITDKFSAYVPSDTSAKYIKYHLTEGDSIIENWASSVLFKLNEPVLYDYLGTAEFVRFVWLRSFENPVILRINKFNDTIYANIKELGGVGSKKAILKIIRDTSLHLEKKDWEKIIEPMKQNAFFNSIYANNFDNKDGAIWFLECRLNSEYKVIKRWDNGYLTSKEVKRYLGPLIDFSQQFVKLSSTR